jgi:tetratricopeptide (TPR) repeat protein
MKNLLILLAILTSLITYGQADSAAWYHQQGIKEKQAGRYREAEKDFTKASKLAPSNIETLIELANTMEAQNRYEEARLDFIKAEQIDANNPVVVENLATLYLYAHQWENAIKYSQKMAQMKINKPVNFTIAKSYYELENYGESLKYCELAFKEEPKRAEIPYIAGRCFIELSNYKRAAGCYEQAIALDSTKPNWMYEAALTYYAMPDDKKSIVWFERAAASGYKKDDDYKYNLGSAYLNVGDLDKGMPLMQDVLQHKPGDTELLESIADGYYHGGKYQDAIDYYDKLLVIDQKNATAMYMMGLSFQKKGDKEKGIQLCDHAISMDPSLKNYKQERKMPGGL